MSQVHQLDATELYCPDWSLPVRQFLNKVPSGHRAHIVTREIRAEARLKLICANYGWTLCEPVMQNDLIHLMVTKI